MARPRKDAVTINRTPEEPGDLCGAKEAATILGYENERTRIARWQRLGKMPKPIAKLASGPVWYRPDIERLARELEREALRA